MSLIVLLVLAVLLGYWLARSQTGERLNQRAGDLSEQVRATGSRTSAWVGQRLGLSRKPRSLRTWAAESPELPEEDRSWLASLDDEQAAAFALALSNHAETLGLDLTRLFSGKLDTDDQQRKVYVEAVSIYSQAYRKAREINQQEEHGSPDSAALEGEVVEGKVVAEKKPSRRRRGSQAEEAASGA